MEIITILHVFQKRMSIIFSKSKEFNTYLNRFRMKQPTKRFKLALFHLILLCRTTNHTRRAV